MKKINKKGFTLIELLSVIVLIGLILGIATTGVIRGQKKAKERTLATKIKNIEKAAIVYGQNHRENFVSVNSGYCENIDNCKYYDGVITVSTLLGEDDGNGPYINADDDNNIEDDDTYMINDNDVPHIVETLIAIDNPKPFFQNQEVIIPTQILLDTNAKLNRFNADATRKKDLLKEYRNIITEYNLDNRINIYSDYFAMLSKEEEKKLSLTK